jgi:hypothetical protein
MLHLSRAAICSTLVTVPVMICSSQRRPRAMDATSVARVSARIGRRSCGGKEVGTMISRRRLIGIFFHGMRRTSRLPRRPHGHGGAVVVAATTKAKPRNAVDKLIRAGLLEEVPAAGSVPVWRRDDDSGAMVLRITESGLKAIDTEGEAVATPKETSARPISSAVLWSRGSPPFWTPVSAVPQRRHIA